jgi:hypothetical protein
LGKKKVIYRYRGLHLRVKGVFFLLLQETFSMNQNAFAAFFLLLVCSDFKQSFLTIDSLTSENELSRSYFLRGAG